MNVVEINKDARTIVVEINSVEYTVEINDSKAVDVFINSGDTTLDTDFVAAMRNASNPNETNPFATVDDVSANMPIAIYDPNNIGDDVFAMDNMVEGITTKILTIVERNKLAGIESGAEINNISDIHATDLTDSGESTLHYHASDRARVNHTGTQLAATISDFTDAVKRGQFLSAGMVVEPSIVDNGNGSVTISAGIVHLYSTTNFVSNLKEYDIVGGTFVLTDGVTNYLIVSYGTGVPVYSVITDVSAINESTIIPVFTIFRIGNSLRILSWDSIASGLPNKLHARFVKTDRFALEGDGLVTTEKNIRELNLTEGVVWVGAHTVTLAACDTLTDAFSLLHHTSGSWNPTPITKYNNTQYDDGINLQLLTTGRYAVNWIYREIATTKRMGVILGSGDHKLNEALEATPPTAAELPFGLSTQGMLVAKVIVQNGSDTAYIIENWSKGIPVGAAATTVAKAVPIQDDEDYFDGGNVEDALQELGETKWTNGFDRYNISTIGELSWDDVTRTFSIDVVVGETEFHFWANGKKIEKTSIQSVAIPNVSGIYFAYFDNDGVLQYVISSGLSLATFYEHAIVGVIRWNSTQQLGAVGDERHGVRMDSVTHHYNHNTFGARYASPGLDIQGLVDGSPTYTQTTNGKFWDEDIEHVLLTQATHKFLYRLGATGEWYTAPASNVVGYKDGADTYYSWNEWTGATWQLTQGGVQTKYFIMFFAAVPSIDGNGVVKIIGHNVYANPTAARAAIEAEVHALQLGDLISPEIVFLYAVIIDRTGDVVELSDGSTYFDLRIAKGGAAGSSALASNALDIATDTTNFDGVLTDTDTNVQKALESLDDYIVVAGALMTEADKMARAAANNDKFGGSGFVEYGTQDAIADTINEGLWVAPTVANLIAMGESGGTNAGTSKTPHPVVNINGFSQVIKSVNEGTVLGQSIIAFPPASALATLTERQDHVRIEKETVPVSTFDMVYPNGLPQSLLATDPATGLATVAGTFTGYDTLSLFGTWQTAGALVGKGLVWSTLSDANKKLFVSDPANNVWLRSDGVVVQDLAFIRVYEGHGTDYDITNAGIFAQGASIIPTAVNFTQDAVDKGLYVAGDVEAIEIALVSRRNQGAFHPVFNPNGSTQLWINTGTGGGTYPWYNANAAIPNSTADCFLFDPTEYAVGHQGNISSGESGRPELDGHYYDAIYEGDVTDLRNSAHKAQLNIRTLTKAVEELKSGGSRGWEKQSTIVLANQNPTAVGTTSRLNYTGIGSYAEIGDEVTILQSGIPFKGFVTIVTTDYVDLENRTYPVFAATAVTDTFALSGLRAIEAKTLLHCDIIGDMVNYPSSWTTPGNKVLGSILSVGEEGEDYVPDGTTKNFKMSGKVKEALLQVYSIDNGVTWGTTTSWNTSIEGATNSIASAHPANQITMSFYLTEASPFETADNAEVLVGGNVLAMNDNAIDQGGLLLSWLLGKIPVGAVANTLGMFETPLTKQVIDGDGLLSTESLDAPEHATIELQGSSNPAGKMFASLTRENGKLQLQALFKEMKYDVDWGDDSKIPVLNGTSTDTDDNGNTVLTRCAVVDLNVFIGDGE